MDFNIIITTPSPKKTSNFLSKLCFTWLITLFHKGTKQTLKIMDLYDNFPSDKSDILGNKLEKYWKMELATAKEKSTKPSLSRAIRKTFFWKYMGYGIVLLIEYAIIRPAQPMVLAIFIKSFSETSTDGKLPTEMYSSAVGMILLTIVTLFFHHHTNLIFGQIGMRVRIACCSLIYRKMMRLSKKSLAHATAGHIVNMMSNDVSRFDLIAPILHHLWIMPIQAAIATYLIWLQVEVASVIGVGSLILLTLPVNTLAGKISAVLRTRIASRTDSRVKKMSEIIAGIQVIKMYAWEKPFAKIVQNERVREINVLTLQSYLRGVILSSCVFLERTALYLTVIAYVLLGNVITADIVFSLAQFFNMLQLSMAIHYPMATTSGSETLVSIKRIQDFLMLEEKATSVVEKDSSKSILLKNVTATWTPETKLLSNVNIDIQPGTLCAVIGPVGMGKSSLLQLLLGELIPKGGRISVGGEISYASQEPWLFASTVQKNILFGLSYNQARYKEVVKVCALEKDFEQFPYGDKMEVGDRGVSLSGGQKARINLARAVYRSADIYLLDDPLSAVDTHVGKHLFQQCVLEYLGDKTRILVTHQLQYLKSADHIVVINNGKIEAQGTFKELSKGDLDFTKMLASAEEGDEMRQAKRRESSVSELSTTTQESEDIEKENNPENEETISYHGASAYYEYFKAGGNICVLLGLVVFFTLGQVFSNLTDLWLTFWTMQEKTFHSKCMDLEVIDVALLNSTSTESSTTILDTDIYGISNVTNDDATVCASLIDTSTSIYIYTALILLGILTLTFRSIYFFKVAMTSSKNLHNNMFYSLLHAPMKFFDTNPSGRILNRFSRDMGMIDELLPRLMIAGLQIFLVMIGILVMVCMTNVYIIAVGVIIGVFFFKLRGWYVTNARNIKHLEGIARSPVFSHMTATLNGITTIRSRSIEDVLAKEFDLHQDTHTAVWYLTLACTSSFGLWMDIISIIFIACVIAGFILIFVYGGIDGSLVGLAISQSMILTGMVQYGIKQVADVVSQMTGVERVLEYSKIEKEGTVDSAKCVTPPKSWPSEGGIKFVKLSLRYSITEPFVLNNLNFTVNAAEKVGIVGRTGAGKSSLIAALFRLAPLDGSILIDNIDTNTINLIDLRKKIAIIPQEPVLFSASLRYNLDPFNEFSDKDLWTALEEVELRDVATSLDFMVDERGSNFSVGQRQLLCLARAILRQNKILILDEATANVDPKTDALIQKTIRHKFSKCTVLTVAHRLNTIMDSDKVLVMDAGKMVEYDHPHLLLQNKDGYLFKMVAETGPSMTKQLHEIAKGMFMEKIAEEQEEMDTQL